MRWDVPPSWIEHDAKSASFGGAYSDVILPVMKKLFTGHDCKRPLN
jgi:hypothetical protein